MKFILVLITFTISLFFSGTINETHAFGQMKAGDSQDGAAVQPAQVGASLSGKVLESMDSGGYTYVQIEKEGNKMWVAVPQMKVTVGQDVSFQQGMVMTNFTSKTLNRTFDAVVFSPGPAGQKSSGPAGSDPHAKQSQPAETNPVKVDKASGPNAYTVAELYEKSSDLDKKDISVKGQVVKFSASIMGKNWIHIQDGSGSSSEGNNDMLVTSQDTLAVGDVVTVMGTLYKDKDFGSGYKYPVIIEEASFKK